MIQSACATIIQKRQYYTRHSLSCAPPYNLSIYTPIHTQTMGEGLTRRRAGAGGSPTTTQSDQVPSSSNPSSSSGNKAPPTNTPSGGGRVAYDPRDFQDDAESNKMPRLTLMEEVLLLGLKDKAVSPVSVQNPLRYAYPSYLDYLTSRLALVPDQLTRRAICHSGTTTSPMRSVDVS